MIADWYLAAGMALFIVMAALMLWFARTERGEKLLLVLVVTALGAAAIMGPPALVAEWKSAQAVEGSR